MTKIRWKNILAAIIIALNFGLFLGDCIASAFADTALSFRFDSVLTIREKNAPTSIELNCNSSTFQTRTLYCLRANVTGKGYFESAVEWSVEKGSLSFFISANQFCFESANPGEAEIKAYSSVDQNISKTFNLTFQESAEDSTISACSTPTFFYSSGANIISYVSDTSIAYNQPLKLNLLLQNSDHNTAFVQSSFRLNSNCYSQLDGCGNVLLDPRDIGKTISGSATIDMGSSKVYTKDFAFQLLNPTDYTILTMGLYTGSFILNSLPFAISSFCLSFILKQKNASSKKTILWLVLLGVLLVGLNAGTCFITSGKNFMLALSTSSLSYLFGIVLSRFKSPYYRGKPYE